MSELQPVTAETDPVALLDEVPLTEDESGEPRGSDERRLPSP